MPAFFSLVRSATSNDRHILKAGVNYRFTFGGSAARY